MALFKTGEELRQEQFQKMFQQASGGFTEMAVRNPLQAGLGRLGAGLGAGLGAAIADEGEAAGDVDLAEFDLGSSKGNFGAAQSLRDAGFEQEAQAMEDRGIKLHKYESSVAAAQAAGDLDKVPEPTDNQLAGIHNYFSLRTDEVGELVQDIREEAADNPAAAAGLNHLTRLVAVNTNEMMRDFEDRHGMSVPRTMIERAMVDGLSDRGIVGEEGFLFWKNPVINVKKAETIVQKVRGGVMDMLLNEQKDPDSRPVETAPAQTSTQFEEATPPPSEAAFVEEDLPEGTVVSGIGEGPKTSPGVPIKDTLPTTRLDYANEIRAIDKELKRAASKGGSPEVTRQLKELLERRNQLLTGLSNLSSR